MPSCLRISSAVLLGLTLGLPLELAAQGGQPPAPVQVAASERRSLATPITLVGSVEAERSSLIAAEVEGPIERLAVREGDELKRGDVLAVVRRRPIELEVQAFRAALESTRALLNEAQDDLERTRRLFEDRVVPERQLVEAREKAASLEREVLRLDASLSLAEDRLERATVRAPFAGIVTEVHVELGQWVSESDPVARLMDLSLMEVTVPLPERFVSQVMAGEEARVWVPSARGEPYLGRVRTVVPEADARSRTFPLIVDIENEDRAIRSGMSSQVQVRTGGERMAVVVPKDALASTPMGKAVFVLQDGRASMRPVETGDAVEGWIEVSGRLEPGEQVIVRGNERLRDGQPVQVQEPRRP